MLSRSCIVVFPTRVGVDRLAMEQVVNGIRFPHTRGGGPHAGQSDDRRRRVFPTRVGVDRPLQIPALT